MTIEGALRDLDFTDNEIKVYIALLRIGSAKAGRISKEAGLERTSAYNALKRLIKIGLVSSIIEANRQVFSAGEPSKIVEVFKEKQERAALLVLQLEKLKKFEREKENVLKFRGFAGVKTALTDIFKTCNPKEEYLIMGSENQLSSIMPTFARIFVARKDQKKLRTRILIRKGLEGQVMSKYTKARYVPQEVTSPAVTNIYGNKVSIILWSEIPEAVIIDNKDVAKTFKSYFEFMWKHAKNK